MGHWTPQRDAFTYTDADVVVSPRVRAVRSSSCPCPGLSLLLLLIFPPLEEVSHLPHQIHVLFCGLIQEHGRRRHQKRGRLEQTHCLIPHPTDNRKSCKYTSRMKSALTPHACKPRNRFSFWKWKLYNCVPALFYHMKSPHKTVRDSKPNRRARVRGPIQILVPGNAVDF